MKPVKDDYSFIELHYKESHKEKFDYSFIKSPSTVPRPDNRPYNPL
jgi:hypothetical protein